MILQSYDYLELYRGYGCTLQIGGSTSGATSPPGSTSFAGWRVTMARRRTP